MLNPAHIITAIFTAVVVINAESHTIHFTNNCGFGTPTLVQNGVILSTGGDFVSNGPFSSADAYLQTGSCGLNGEGCTLIETTLINPTSPGTGSLSDISLIPPHTFSVASGFEYFGAPLCNGVGADCTNVNCDTAFRFPVEDRAIACQADNVNLNITFCD